MRRLLLIGMALGRSLTIQECARVRWERMEHELRTRQAILRTRPSR